MILFFILVFLFLSLITSKIKIEIKDFNFNTKIKGYILKNYEVNIIFKIFYIIPIFKIKINDKKVRDKFKNSKLKNRLEKEKIKISQKKIGTGIFEIIKKLRIQIKEINLKLQIGAEDAAVTAMIVPIISTAISLFLTAKMKKDSDKEKFLISPIYNQNLINLEISGIFQIEMIHIINTICVLNKKRKGDKNERTSNRRSYDYSYE